MGTGWQAFGWCVAASAGALLLLRLIATEVQRTERTLARFESRERQARARRLEMEKDAEEPEDIVLEKAV